jgi:PKD repeat protein
VDYPEFEDVTLDAGNPSERVTVETNGYVTVAVDGGTSDFASFPYSWTLSAERSSGADDWSDLSDEPVAFGTHSGLVNTNDDTDRLKLQVEQGDVVNLSLSSDAPEQVSARVDYPEFEDVTLDAQNPSAQITAEANGYVQVDVDGSASEFASFPYSWTLVVGPPGTNRPPAAALDYSPSAPTVGESVAFDASGSTDADGQVATYEWDFDGDGVVDATTTTPRATHAYGSTGAYDASLTVVDDDGATDAATRTVTVESSDGGGEAPPPVGGSSTAPRDPDGDGRYEDVDGDGTVGVADVATLFYNLDGPAVGDHPDAFDFNDDGSCDVIDVSALFDALP